VTSDSMRCVLVSWHFSPCTRHFRALEVLHGGHSRESLNPESWIHLTHPLRMNAVCTNLDISSAVTKARFATSWQFKSCSLFDRQNIKNLLMRGPMIRLTPTNLDALERHAMLPYACFLLRADILSHLTMAYFRHLHSPNPFLHMQIVLDRRSGRAWPGTPGERWVCTSSLARGSGHQTLPHNSRACLYSLAKRTAA
jgi:hypothetical protein